MASLLQRLRTYFSDDDLVTITPAMYKAKLAHKKEQAEAMARIEEHQAKPKALELHVGPSIPKDEFVGPIPQRRNSDHIKFDPPLPEHDKPIIMKFTPARQPNVYRIPPERDVD